MSIDKNKFSFYFSYLKLYLYLLFLIFALFHSPPNQIPDAQAQEPPKWSEPIIISPPIDENRGYSWFPEIVTDLTGQIHIFWVNWRKVEENIYGGYDLVLYCQIKSERCTEATEVIAYDWGGGINATRPAAAVDQYNNIHLLSRGIGPGTAFNVIFHSQAPALEADMPSSWSTKQVLSTGNTNSYYSDIAIDSKGVIYVVWNQRTIVEDRSTTTCFECAELYHRYSEDGGKTWSNLFNLSNTLLADDKPQIVIDKDDHVYVFWEIGQDALHDQGQPNASAMSYSTDGMTWSLPTQFIFPGDAPQRITAGIDAFGHIVVVWGLATGKGIYFQTSADKGLSWSIPRPIPGVSARSQGNAELDDYHIATDSAGDLHLVLVGSDPADARHHSVFHLRWDGKAWTSPETIFTSIGDLPEWPRITVSQGNQLHVVWFTRNEANAWESSGEGVDYKVWYAHSQSLAPAEAPVEILPTATPLPTATSLPTPTPNPTPTIDPAALQATVPAGLTDSLYTDYDEIFVLVQSLLPAVFVIGLVIIVVRMWRR